MTTSSVPSLPPGLFTRVRSPPSGMEPIRAFPVEFADLGSVRVACPDGDQRRRRHRADDLEELGALKRYRWSEADGGGRCAVVIAGLRECRHHVAFLGVGQFCFAFEHRVVSLVNGVVGPDWNHEVVGASFANIIQINVSRHIFPVKP